MNLDRIQMWDDNKGKRLLLIALLMGLVVHGSIVYFTMPQTYDAFVHMFFADHYSRFWFEPWEFRWYTGFLTVSYPPLNHQAVALISKLFPLKVAFCIYAMFIFQVLIVGVYRFSKLFFDKVTAGVAAILVVVLSSIVETLHVYGQLPTLSGIGFLLNALPFLYQYIKNKRGMNLLMALSFLAVVVCSHHVTVVFGLVFFIAPTILMALIDDMKPKEREGSFLAFVWAVLLKAYSKHRKIILFGLVLLVLVVGLIFPYWYWSKTDPINQVSIPHGSRDNFFTNTSSGLVFFVIPLILIIGLLPAISFSIVRKKRFIGWALAFFLCLVLGSGGSTPIAKLILGEYAFNILTLDRFGFWASIIAIPFMAKFLHSFVAGKVRNFLISKFEKQGHFIVSGITGLSYFLFLIFIFHLGSFRPLQPKEIEIHPILNFLNRDNHNHWRYLTLGFGDQMAWLSANTLASTVDGNYHSARRLPELTSRPIERLENAKFSGDDGLASLGHFLSQSEEYSLKYVFSNDRYYDPLLYYHGWNRTIRLENGVMVWEKGNISTIKPVEPKEISPLLKKTWGIFPVTSLCLAIALTLIYLKRGASKEYNVEANEKDDLYPNGVVYSASFLPALFFSGFMLMQLNELLWVKEQKDPVTTALSYYNHLDFHRFEKAFTFFKPSVTYPMDQYLLEKSVLEGGLVPTYAKLDSISVKELEADVKNAVVEVFTSWNTSLGKREKIDTLDMVLLDNKWFIVPPEFIPEIPDEQMRSYTYTLFKKQGKRVVSSFPTVKDDRVKKPFAAFKQANLIKFENQYRVTGEVLNADDIPINVALKARIYLENGEYRDNYPRTGFLYNLAPKGSSYFQIDIEHSEWVDSLGIREVELVAETDVSERGYIHGPTTSYYVRNTSNHSQVEVNVEYYNEFTTEVNIPAVLITEKDSAGVVWQTQLNMHTNAVRSGMHASASHVLEKIQHNAILVDQVPVLLKINGKERKRMPLLADEVANNNLGVAIQTHCFISDPIYLH